MTIGQIQTFSLDPMDLSENLKSWRSWIFRGEYPGIFRASRLRPVAARVGSRSASDRESRQRSGFSLSPWCDRFDPLTARTELGLNRSMGLWGDAASRT